MKIILKLVKLWGLGYYFVFEIYGKFLKINIMNIFLLMIIGELLLLEGIGFGVKLVNFVNRVLRLVLGGEILFYRFV